MDLSEGWGDLPLGNTRWLDLGALDFETALFDKVGDL